MKKILQTVYTILLSVASIGGAILAFVVSWNAGVPQAAGCVMGVFLSFILAPFFHEIGHVVFALGSDMRIVYTKFFCVRLYEDGGKLKPSLASPFEPEETQAVPKSSKNMRRRALWYTAGGLIFGGAYLIVVAVLAFLLPAPAQNVFFGALPYAAYLFFLNAVPMWLVSGKTDALIYRGILRGEAEENAMVSSMEIYGFLSEGKRFSEIEHSRFSFPVVREDAPMYAVIADLRYRYFLDIGNFDAAANEINRLALCSGYLSELQAEEVAAELSFMHSLSSDLEKAEETRALAGHYLAEEELSSLRINAAYYKAKGDEKKAKEYIKKALEKLESEPIFGKRKWEEKRILEVKE